MLRIKKGKRVEHFLKALRKIRAAIFPENNFLAIVTLLVAASVLSFVFVVFFVYENPIPKKLERVQVNTSKNIVNDVTELNPVQTLGIIVPHTNEDIINAVKLHEHVSIGGGRNSMGGQTASTRAVQLDMREFNKVLSFSKDEKLITVQSGIRWRDIQDYIDPYNLSVKIMQTYSNFTVGGSLSVNVHGRYVGLGPIILSVKSFRIVLADGSVVEASPVINPDIFYSAIGGMGGIGVITDVTLSLADNVNVERNQVTMSTKEYGEYFKKNVRDNKDVIFHNGDMYPLDFDTVSAVSWVKTDKEVTTKDRLIPRFQDYWKERVAWVIMSEWPGGLWLREHVIDPLLYAGEKPVHTRNYEASYDVAELEPKDRNGSTYVLQEYFVPVEKFDEWVPKMKKVFVDNDVNVINVSIRHALPDAGAKLAWAKTESFAFVVYYKQGTSDEDKKKVGIWTREMIDEVISVGGAYYLPYQLHATDEQIHKAYPHLDEYFSIKKYYDKTDKFTNSLWDKYYKDDAALESESTRESKADYVRPLANTYVSLPEWYIVYSADEYARVLKDGMPSLFPFSSSNKEYWDEYAAVMGYSDGTKESKDYLTVLNVIGVSFSLENSIKALYENTIGRITEKLADGVRVPEDDYAAKIAKDYATLIYDYPWYDFKYASCIQPLWSLSSGMQPFTFGQNIRRIERKIYLTIELSVKSVYSSVIAFATHQKFGIQDDVICATVSYNLLMQKKLFCAPHYQPFTKSLLLTLESEKNNPYFVMYDIAGNDKIVITFRKKVEQTLDTSLLGKELMEHKEIEGVRQDGVIIYSDRVTTLISVSSIPNMYKILSAEGIKIDHFYDY